MSKAIFFSVSEDCQTLEQTLASWQQGKSIKLHLGKTSENFGAFKEYPLFYLTVCRERIIDIKEIGADNFCLTGKGFIIAIDFSLGIGSLSVGTE